MTHDFRLLGVSVEDIGEGLSWREAIDLAVSLAGSFGSHVHAALVGWAWPATWSDILAVQQLSLLRSALGVTGKIPTPWDEAQAPVADPGVVEELAAELAARSAIRPRGGDHERDT